MIQVKRFINNPILAPDSNISWQARAVFNGCPIVLDNSIFLLYRAESSPVKVADKQLSLSTIGIVESKNDFNFDAGRQIVVPEHDWEQFGCEDPRVVFFEDRFFIFYTAISSFPPNPGGIKVGLAISPDLKAVSEKHLVTPFNAKAMVLFPERINRKIMALLAVNTDLPPSEIGLVEFDEIDQLWDHQFWQDWYEHIEVHSLPLQRRPQDHVETGAIPIKTQDGWLLIYSYINNYLNSKKRILTIEAALLDLADPRHVIGRSRFPLLVPEADYELNGMVSDIVFPSGALVNDNQLQIFYGAADTCCCLASCSLDDLLRELKNDSA